MRTWGAVLTKVTINQFRSCHDVTLSDLGAVVVLIGRNGAGKSNILRSVMWAVDVALRSLEPERYEAPRSVTLEFRIRDFLYRYSVETKVENRRRPVTPPQRAITFSESISVQTPGNDWRQLAVRRGDEVELTGGAVFRLGGDVPFLMILLAYPSVGEDVSQHLRGIEGFLKRVRYYPFDEPNDSSESVIISKRAYQSWLASSGDSRGTDTSVLMKLLHMKLSRPDDFEEVFSILGADGLGILNGLSVKEYPTKGSLTKSGEDSDLFVYFISRFYPATGSPGERHDPWLSFDDLSLGTRRIIRIVVAMIFDQSSVMLIEHPEDGIHRGLTRKLFGQLRSYSDRAQVILSSHSGLVLDDLRDDTGAVRLVMMENGATKAHALSPGEAAQARKYIDEDGAFSEFIESRFDL